MRRLKFPKHHIADPVGYAGVIWVNWDDNLVKADVILSSTQLVHVSVEPKPKDASKKDYGKRSIPHLYLSSGNPLATLEGK